MKVNWLKFISVVFLFCMLLSCRKDEDFEYERLSEASYYNHSRNCITTTVFKYENGRVTSYSSLHYDHCTCLTVCYINGVIRNLNIIHLVK